MPIKNLRVSTICTLCGHEGRRINGEFGPCNQCGGKVERLVPKRVLLSSTDLTEGDKERRKCVVCGERWAKTLVGHCNTCHIRLVYRRRPEIIESLKHRNYEPRQRYRLAKNGSTRQQGLVWELSLEQFSSLIVMNCHYCDSPPEQTSGRGIDRMDNAKGYTLDNVVPACCRCNRSRADHWSYEEFKVMISAVKAHWASA